MKTIGFAGEAPGEALTERLARLGWGLERAAPETARLWLAADPETEREALTRARPDAEVLRLPTSAAIVALRLDRQHRLGQAVRRDPLTGLASRQQLEETLSGWRARLPTDRVVALVVLDLDRFKSVNDTHGHAAGDELLRGVGKALLATLEFGDVAGRLGGDEFLIALARPRPSDVRDEVERLRARVAAQGLPGGPELRSGASAGLAWWQPEETLDAVLARADAALYAAKARGRDRLCIDDAGAADDGYGDELQRFLDLTQVYTDRLTQMVQLRSRRLVERARHDAFQDRLTGAHNRRYFDQRLAREGEQSLRHGLPLSLVFLDLDDFGQVNRRHGYEAGDAALRHVVDALQPLVRLTDWLARWGGEEFCLVLPGTALDEAAGIADRVHAAVSATACGLPDGGTLHLTCSVGVATGVGADGLTERASAAARRAKAAGKNRVVLDRG